MFYFYFSSGKERKFNNKFGLAQTWKKLKMFKVKVDVWVVLTTSPAAAGVGSCCGPLTLVPLHKQTNLWVGQWLWLSSQRSEVCGSILVIGKLLKNVYLCQLLWKDKIKQIGREWSQKTSARAVVVTVFAFYSSDPSLYPAKVYSSFS